MNKDLEDIDDDKDGITLKYKTYYDKDALSAYVKFSGFSDERQMAEFIKFIEPYIPLILYHDDVKH